MVDSEQEHDRKELRRVDRRYLVFYLRVFEGLNHKILGHLIDISEKGIMLICDNPIKVHTTYSLRMCLPNQMKDQDEVIFSASGRWCKRDANPDFYLAGFEIAALEPVTRHLIATLIRDFSQSKQ